MRVYEFSQKQFIAAGISDIWNFFSDPKNLDKITPPGMRFKILDDGGRNEISEGQFIRYNVSPFPFFTTTWVTEIASVNPHVSFVDTQKKGPFVLWRHRHEFKVLPGGVEMIDVVHYAVPLGWIGVLANLLFVRSRVNYIFQYRRKRVENIFLLKPAAA